MNKLLSFYLVTLFISLISYLVVPCVPTKMFFGYTLFVGCVAALVSSVITIIKNHRELSEE